MERGSAVAGIRPSDAERERVIRALRDRTAEGRLSYDSFVGRLDRAFHARSRAELAELVRDLPPAGRFTRLLTETVERASTLTSRLESAWRGARPSRFVPPGLVLPEDAGRLTVGRAAERDLVVAKATVSRYHAEFHRVGNRWMLVDLDSTNGTRLNGHRVASPRDVHDGDHVAFGGVSFRVHVPP